MVMRCLVLRIVKYLKTSECIQFYKMILKAKKSTPNLILYDELGRYPINIVIKSRMVGFWQRLVNGKPDKISSKL